MHFQHNGRFVRIGRSRGLFGKLLAGLLAVGLIAVSFLFSLAVLAVAVVGGALGWAYLWWKTRALRRQLREQGGMAQTIFRQQAANDARPEDEGMVLDGEVIREVPEEDARR